MGAAPLQRDDDGQVAWDRMWQGFCELALAGGPPHRGTLHKAAAGADAAVWPPSHQRPRENRQPSDHDRPNSGSVRTTPVPSDGRIFRRDTSDLISHAS